MITAFSSIEGAIDAMKQGAFHYIPKPFKNEEVRLTIRKGLERRQLKAENRALKEQLHGRFGFDRIIGKSKPIQQVFDLIRLAAPSKSNILILGDCGTGKELVAKAIHHNSKRRNGPFVTVNSGSMPADLLESNLFGHVKGSFTGAISNKKGLFELANGGSIFFDEIGNIPLETQAKLLRVIQEKEFMRLGGVEVLKADVRIIAATNADLEDLVERGAFREDLYYRLNVITIHLPALRKRAEDIPLIANHFLQTYARENEKTIREIAPRRDAAPDGLPLAGQRARAGERDRARGGALDRRRPRRRPAAADGAPARRAPAPDGDPAVERALAQGRGVRLRAPAHRQGAAGVGRRAEEGGRAAQREADHAP